MLYDGKHMDRQRGMECVVSDRVTGDASLMRVLEQSCKGVSHADLPGSE